MSSSLESTIARDSSLASDFTWHSSDSSEPDTVSESDSFYDTQNDFKLLGELLNDGSQ
jgi:hypothetical protein